MLAAARRGLRAVAFGDLFLEDVRAYREERMRRVGKTALFPVWGLDTTTLARAFLDQAFAAHVVCVDTRRLGRLVRGAAR